MIIGFYWHINNVFESSSHRISFVFRLSGKNFKIILCCQKLKMLGVNSRIIVSSNETQENPLELRRIYERLEIRKKVLHVLSAGKRCDPDFLKYLK